MFALGLAAMIAVPSGASTVSPLKMMKDVKMRLKAVNEGVGMRRTPRRNTKEDNSKEAMRISELARRMKPGTTKTFGWDGRDWMPDDTYTYAYDPEGHVTVENAEDVEGFLSRTVNEYDSNGMLKFKMTTVSEDGVVFENYSKSEFEYDPILTKVITERGEWLWMEGEWQQVANNYKRIITRDDQGNITSCVIAVLFQGIYDPTMRLEVTYGPDGKAVEISEKSLSFNYDTYEYYWEQGTVISDIVWERTDGQIYDIEDIFMGNNRIGSAHYLDPDGLDMNVTVEYADDSEAYTATMSMTMDGMSVTATSEYIPLENDGYIGTGTTYFMGEEMYSSREEYRYDDWGLMTLSMESETEEGFTYGKRTIGEVEYDTEGKPTVYTISETFFDTELEEEETEYVIRAEYSDYIDVTAGVSSVGIHEAHERWYDLNGMPVAAPEKGRIVVKEGKKRIEY